MRTPAPRSRLAKQENKRLWRQTVVIMIITMAFLGLFLFVGVPALIKMAIAWGNAKSSSRFTQQEDTIPPLPPQFKPLPEATFESTITLEGYAETGTVVTLRQDTNIIADTTADNEGQFIFPDIQLNEGLNNFTALAKDMAGNESQQSSPQSISFDNTPPNLEITKPVNGASVYGTLQKLADITGTVEPGTQLTLNDRVIVVTGAGTFNAKYDLQEGENKLNFVATDEAGNQTTQEITVNFSR